MAGDLDSFADREPGRGYSRAFPGCCQIPRELMGQVEANFARPAKEQKSIAACTRWLAAEGHPIDAMKLRNHVRNGHAERFA